jgi:nucleotidyltransferase/DNA polymerase involved in DNA repair
MAAAPAPRLVFCVDADAFFVQIHQARDPALAGRPVAVQQHGDIIAANAAAKAIGVRKHTPPAAARALLAPAGGALVRAHTLPDGRVSYAPYRAAGAALERAVRAAAPWAAAVERSSVDELYLRVEAEAGAESGGATAAGAAALARRLRAAVLAASGFAVSVGVGRCRLAAKLASRAAKPPADGVAVALDPAAVDALLGCSPAELPGMGGRAGAALAALGAASALDLRRFSAAELAAAAGVGDARGALLAAWSRGEDPTPVEERGPPVSLSVQMALMPMELPVLSAWAAPPAGGGAPGRLRPLAVDAPDFAARAAALVAAMAPDLLERVREDAAQERRWPTRAGVHLRVSERVAGRTCAFPPASLAPPALAAATGAALRAAFLAAATALPPGSVVESVRLAASGFEAADARAAPITRFFFRAEPAPERADAGAEASRHSCGAEPAPAMRVVDLGEAGLVDVAEQRRLLAEVERARRRRAAPPRAGGAAKRQAGIRAFMPPEPAPERRPP